MLDINVFVGIKGFGKVENGLEKIKEKYENK